MTPTTADNLTNTIINETPQTTITPQMIHLFPKSWCSQNSTQGNRENRKLQLC